MYTDYTVKNKVVESPTVSDSSKKRGRSQISSDFKEIIKISKMSDLQGDSGKLFARLTDYMDEKFHVVDTQLRCIAEENKELKHDVSSLKSEYDALLKKMDNLIEKSKVKNLIF